MKKKAIDLKPGTTTPLKEGNLPERLEKCRILLSIKNLSKKSLLEQGWEKRLYENLIASLSTKKNPRPILKSMEYRQPAGG